MALIAIGVSWLVGIGLGSMAGPVPGWLWAPAIPLLALIPILRRPLWRKVAASAALLVLGVCRSAAAAPRIESSTLARYNDRGKVTVVGLVVEDPEQVKGMVRVRVAARALEADGSHDVSGALLATIQPYPEVLYGDVVQVTGKPATPPEYPDFSYRDYLARKGVFSILNNASASVLEHGRGNPVLAALSAVRRHAATAIARMLPEPEAALLTGILLGKDDGIPSDVTDAFRAAGTAHIIAISGFNIALIAGALSRVLRRVLRPTPAAILAIAGIAVYTFLVGANPSVARAAIMGGLCILATVTGRQAYAPTLLAVAAMAMTAIDPLTLFDVGFQLSFLATLGMILFATPLSRWAQSLARRCGGAASAVETAFQPLIATLAAMMLTMPLMVYQFRTLSLIALPANLVIGPLQPAIMLLGGLGTVLGSVWVPLGQLLAWLAWPFLALSVRASEWFASLPGAGIQVARPPVAAIVATYAVLLAAVRLAPRLRGVGSRLRRSLGILWQDGKVVGVLALVGVLLWAGALRMPDGRTHVTFLNVGGGDAVLIQAASGATVLIDGGADPARLLAELGRRIPFWQRHIDLAVLTHPHIDHLGGLVAAAERYRFGAFVEGVAADSAMHRELLDRLTRAGTSIVPAQDGQVVRLGADVELEVLWPRQGTQETDPNEQSLVLTLTAGRASFLLTGDLGIVGQAALLRRGEVGRCLVLKAPHHGSREVLPEFLKVAAPQVVVITENPSAAATSSSAAYLGIGARVLATGKDGAIEISTDMTHYWVHEGR